MRFPPFLVFLCRAYLTLIGVSTLLRLILLGVALEEWRGLTVRSGQVLQAFVIGWRFDTSVACYLLALPFLLLSITWLFGKGERRARQVAHVFLLVLALPVALMLAADIPWFLHNYARLSTSALAWADDAGFMLGMVAGEGSFAKYALLFVGLYALLALGFRWAKAELLREPAQRATLPWRLSAVLLSGLVIFLGMRGRLDEKSPLQPGTAYFSDDPFINQLGLNPVFTFGTSLERSLSGGRHHVQLADEEQALWYAVQELGAQPDVARSPIARRVQPTQPVFKGNVVIILLESMSRFKMGAYGGPPNLTPFLSALEKVSLSCDHAYSAGIHTYNGIYSTLYSFPALYDEQPLENLLNKRHKGLANVLRDNGYSTLFCTTHDPEFDNMKGFLTAHGFDRVISEDDYPQEWVASTNGVPDHRMFEHVLPELNKLAAKGPFLSVFMTTSDHKPYILPDSLWFEPQSTKLEDRIVEYVDRSVARFFELASAQPWYRNTVFVILGDHGVNMGHTYDMPLAFHHTPLIFHVPGGQVSPGRISAPCGQIDVAPTVLGMLNLPWTNTTMGLDIRQRQRTCMYFCADDRIGCIDPEFYFIHRVGATETLYRHERLSSEDLSALFPEKQDSLRSEAFNMMQATQWLIDHDLLDGGAPETQAPLP